MKGNGFALEIDKKHARFHIITMGVPTEYLRVRVKSKSKKILFKVGTL